MNDCCIYRIKEWSAQRLCTDIGAFGIALTNQKTVLIIKLILRFISVHPTGIRTSEVIHTVLCGIDTEGNRTSDILLMFTDDTYQG